MVFIMRRRRSNSGYSFNVDQRRTQAGTIPSHKHFIERNLGMYNVNLWTPSSLTTSLWLDANDLSTLTYDGSFLVSQWNDKSGNGRNAKTSGVSRPLLSISGFNINNMITFDGVEDYINLSSTSLFSSGNSNITIIAAYRAKVEYGLYGTLIANYPSGNFQYLFGGQLGYMTTWGIFNDSDLYLDDDDYRQNINIITVSVRRNGSFTGFKYGVQKNTVGNTASVYSGTGTSSGWKIGANYSNSQKGNMDLYELICMNSAISDSDREKVEGYLAHKWRLAANLPDNHKYKNSAP